MTKRRHSRQQSLNGNGSQHSSQHSHSSSIQHSSQQPHVHSHSQTSQPSYRPTSINIDDQHSSQQTHATNQAVAHYRPAAISVEDLVTAPQYYTDMTSSMPPQTHYTYQGGPVLQQYSYDANAPLYAPTQSSAHLIPPEPTPTHTHSQSSLGRSSSGSSSAWHANDDEILLRARQEGMNWIPIKKKYFPHKSANACRKHHERLVERRKADEWDGGRLERVAREYMSMRQELWTPLATRTGEKWTVVEAKCMGSGLKNLQSADRSARRRERLSDSHDTASGSSEYGHGYDAHTPNSVMGFVEDVSDEYDGHNAVGGDLSHHQTSHMGGGAQYGNDMSGSTQYDNGHRLPSNDMNGNTQYDNGQRLPSMDMGIDAIINRDALNRDGHGRDPSGKRSHRRQQ